jgi:hypothetical protein
MLWYNPKQLFADSSVKAGFKRVFDYDAMRRWLDQFNQLDESGLPIAMVHKEWYKQEFKSSVVRRDGVEYMDLELWAYEYEDATKSWSRLCAHVKYSLVKIH